MDPDTKLRLSDEIAYQYAGGKVVVMQAKGSVLYTLNETATAIWKLLADKTSLGGIHRYIEEHYEGEAAEKRKEVEEFLQQLIGSGVAIAEP
jgi:Coenzyme PQQ synthesis protein D (PqqD)